MADNTAAQQEAVQDIIRRRAREAQAAEDEARQAADYEKKRKEARRLPASQRLHELTKPQETRIH